jgi:hypothetical protein
MSEKQIHAFTEPRGPSPAYVNLTEQSTEGGAAVYRLTVRTRGTSLASVIYLDRDQVRDLVLDAARHLTASLDACPLPPRGWRCTREPGHNGPCAAVPVNVGGDHG